MATVNKIEEARICSLFPPREKREIKKETCTIQITKETYRGKKGKTSKKMLLHSVSIRGPLGYEPNTLPLRHGAIESEGYYIIYDGNKKQNKRHALTPSQ
jgi:hypothetical protein